jgi:hypothetical protein
MYFRRLVRLVVRTGHEPNGSKEADRVQGDDPKKTDAEKLKEATDEVARLTRIEDALRLVGHTIWPREVSRVAYVQFRSLSQTDVHKQFANIAAVVAGTEDTVTEGKSDMTQAHEFAANHPIAKMWRANKLADHRVHYWRLHTSNQGTDYIRLTDENGENPSHWVDIIIYGYPSATP